MNYKEYLDISILYASNLNNEGLSVDDAITDASNKFGINASFISKGMCYK